MTKCKKCLKTIRKKQIKFHDKQPNKLEKYQALCYSCYKGRN